MENIQYKIKVLRGKIEKKQTEDGELRKQINKFFSENYKNSLIEGFISDIYKKNNILFISVKNKSLANDIFFNKKTILERLGKDFNIKDIKIN